MPEAMTLCTATQAGRPSGRMVLMKGLSPAGFDFYTGYDSRKARELSENPYAALVFWWVELDRQVRVEGAVGRLGDAQSDAYFGSRPLGSRISATASRQSRPIANREVLERRVAEVAAGLGDKDPPRPQHWGGYRLSPQSIEFWQGRHDRLHDRFLYELDPGGDWSVERLSP